MKYTLKLLWHGAILLGRVGWIIGGMVMSFFLIFLSRENSHDDEKDADYSDDTPHGTPYVWHWTREMNRYYGNGTPRDYE